METLQSAAQKLKTFLLFKLAVHQVWESGPGWMIGSVVLLVLQGLMPLVTLYLMKIIVDAITAGLTSPDKAAAFREAGFWILLAGGAALLNAALSTLAGIFKDAQRRTFSDHMQHVIHERSVELDLEYYENSEYYDTLHRAQLEGSYRPVSVVDSLANIGRNGISLLAVATLLFSLHWAVGLILLAASAPGFLMRLKFAEKKYRWQRDRTPVNRKAHYFRILLTTDRPAKEIRIFGLGPLLIGWYQDLRKRLRGEALKMNVEISIGELVAQALGILAVFGTFALLAFRTVHGSTTVGDLVMYYQAIQRGMGFLNGLLGSLTGLYEDALFLSHLDEFLSLKKTVREPAQPQPIPRPMKEGVLFDSVTFTYPGDSRQVIEEVSLFAKPGEIVALVGENGAGKSTLIKLLCRFYDPSGGLISIDGTDVREFATADLRREISPIFQDYFHFDLTTGENIWLGNVTRPNDLERIVSAARLAGADDFIQRLPRSYETILGRQFGAGTELSIGQWQSLSLARALFRDGQILVLDEPTSAQDARSEYEFFKRVRRLAVDRVTIIVSHRFSTVRMADRIYVMHKGRIIECGTHDELIAGDGTYAELYNMQARAWT